MIELTRLNGSPMVLNSDLIKTAEASPDTMLTLINGEKLIVREECADVVERVLAYRARLLADGGEASWLPGRSSDGGIAGEPGCFRPAACAGSDGPGPRTLNHERSLHNRFAKEHPMDKASFGGVVLAIAGIVAGLLIEGGNLGQICSPQRR